jgi:hypothetical protein
MCVARHADAGYADAWAGHADAGHADTWAGDAKAWARHAERGMLLQGMLAHTPSRTAISSLLPVAGPRRRSSSFTPDFTIHMVCKGLHLHISIFNAAKP